MSNPHCLALYLVFHLSTRCNLECTYCNVHAGPGGRRPVLDLRVFERWLEAFAALEPAEMAIQLHGGEPLVIEPSVELYAAVARNTLARFPRTRLSLVGIQTNGLKLDEARLDALESAGVSVNISIDGPAAIHDRQRRTATGGGSHRGAVRAWQRLRQRGRGAGVISVVTDPRDVVPALEYFLDSGLSEARMNPMRPEGRAAQARDWSESGFMRDMAAQYAHAAQRIAEHNRSHPQAPFYEDNLAGLMRALLGGAET